MTSKAVDVTKDLLSFGTGSLVVLVGLYWVKQMAETGAITGEAAMVVFVSVIGMAATFLFGTAMSRTNTRAFERGLNTPGPNETATVVTGDNPTVQSGGPTVTGDNVRVSTPTVNAP